MRITPRLLERGDVFEYFGREYRVKRITSGYVQYTLIYITSPQSTKILKLSIKSKQRIKLIWDADFDCAAK